MADILPGPGGSGPAELIHSEANDFSTGSYSIPSGVQETGLLWTIENDSGDTINVPYEFGMSISGNEIQTIGSDLSGISDGTEIYVGDRFANSDEITANTASAEVACVIRAYRLEEP